MVLSTVVAVVIAFFGLAAGINIGIALGLAGMAGVIIFTGVPTAAFSLPYLVGVEVASTYGFLVIPLFILMGQTAARAGITDELFDAAHRWVGHYRGGLAVSTILTCAGMAAITGSTVATAATMTSLALPQMRKFNYKDLLSLGSICAGGTLSIMIPPSTVLVLYAIFADQSIGKLLLAGLFPGLLTAFLYMIQIGIRTRLRPSLGPPGPKYPLAERLASLAGVTPFFAIVLAILLGILLGVWTPVEAAGGGVIAVFIMGGIRRRLGLRDMGLAAREAAIISCSVIVLVTGGIIFTKFLAITGLNQDMTQFIMDLDLDPPILFSLFLFLYLVLGMFLEGASIFALTVPLFMPLIVAVGWDPIWWGVVLTAMMEVAAITPPVGLNLYSVKAVAHDVELSTIFLGSSPFIVCNFIVIWIMYLAPDFVLWLPNLIIE